MRRRWLWLALCAAGSANAIEVPMVDAGIIGTESDGIDSAVAADLDGDGDTDLVYASRTGNRVSWSRNERTGFAPRQVLFNMEGVRRLAVADFNLDGRQDLVTANVGGALAVHLGEGVFPNGLPDFRLMPAIATGLTGVTRLATGDINADGHPDLVVGREEVPVLQTFLFTGTGSSFAAAVNVSVPNGIGTIAGIAVADVDVDGINDLVVTGNTLPGAPVPVARLFVVPRTSASAFGTAQVVESASGSTRFGDLVAANFSFSGGADVAWIVNPDGDVVIRRNTVNSLTEANARAVAIDTASPLDALTTADIDGFATTEIAYNGDFGNSGTYGRLSGSANQPFLLSRGVNVPVNDAVATFAFDQDIDGDVDLMVAQAAGTLRLARNTRIHGRAWLPGNYDAHTTTQVDGVPLAGPFEVVTRRELRGDRTEALFTEFDGGRVRSLTAVQFDGSLIFSTTQPTPVIDNVTAARDIGVMDFDNDGDTDFVLATGASSAPGAANTNRIVVSRNGPTPVNTVQNACTQGQDIRGVAIGKVFNQIGGVGIAYASEDNDRVAVISSCPAETLVSTPENGVPNGPGVVKLGDLDQDGDQDLLVAARFNDEGNTAGDLVGWYPNLGNNTFGALQRIAVVNGAREATLLDFNRDGKLDVGASGDGNVMLFPNTGGGVFGTPVVAATGIVGAGRIEAADLDLDGDIDLVVPSESDAGLGPDRTQCGLNLIEATAPGVFAAPQCIDDDEDEQIPWSRAAIADVARNGLPDIIATSYFADKVAVFGPLFLQQYDSAQTTLQADVMLEPGVETCVRSLRLRHLGRTGDSAIRYFGNDFRVTGGQGAFLVRELVLRRDDGDGVPTPATDPVLARSGEAVFNNGSAVWNLLPNVDQGVADGERTYWICVLPPAKLLPFAGNVFLGDDGPRVFDSVGRDIVFGTHNADPAPRLQSPTVFRDGMENP